MKDAAEDLQAKEQADASAREAARGAPHNLELQAAAVAAAAALAQAQDNLFTAVELQANTLAAKLKGVTCGTKDDYRVKEAEEDLWAAERADASAQEAARGAPQDPGLQAAAAAAAAAAAVARDAHGKAQQQKAYTAKGKQSGSRNGHPAKGPNTQACRGCGKLGGSAHTLPPHTNLTHL